MPIGCLARMMAKGVQAQFQAFVDAVDLPLKGEPRVAVGRQVASQRGSSTSRRVQDGNPRLQP